MSKNTKYIIGAILLTAIVIIGVSPYKKLNNNTIKLIKTNSPKIYTDDIEFELDFNYIDNELQYNCSNKNADIKVYKQLNSDNNKNSLYYVQLPIGEYQVEYVGKDSYQFDTVANLCLNSFLGYSKANGELVDNSEYTIENLPTNNSSIMYTCAKYKNITRKALGKDNITINNGDKLIINDSKKQLLCPFLDYDNLSLIKLYKLK